VYQGNYYAAVLKLKQLQFLKKLEPTSLEQGRLVLFLVLILGVLHRASSCVEHKEIMLTKKKDKEPEIS